MDRELDVTFRRRRLGRRVALGAPAMALALAVFVLLPGWLRPSLERSEVRTAVVERGPVEHVVEAAGTVVPAFERVLSSPVEARVVRILKRPGEPVRLGEEVLELDTSASRLDLGRLEDRLAQKRNEAEQLRLALDTSLAELAGRIETTRLDTEVGEYRAEQNRKLRAEGLVSDEVLKASEVEARKARIELAQLTAKTASERRSTDARLAAVALDVRILEKERDEARRQLELATTRADLDGVVTWVVPEEGATVGRGEVVARIARLDSFRVEAAVSDVHASRLRTGLPVRVVIDGRQLPGRLESIHPTIENGALKFTVGPDDPADPELRNDLRVDVLVVTGARARTLRVRKGAFGTGAGEVPVFVVKDGEAVRRSVRFGLAGYEHGEVLAGLAEGDEVILTDMREHRHLERLKLR